MGKSEAVLDGCSEELAGGRGVVDDAGVGVPFLALDEGGNSETNVNAGWVQPDIIIGCHILQSSHHLIISIASSFQLRLHPSLIDPLRRYAIENCLANLTINLSNLHKTLHSFVFPIIS